MKANDTFEVILVALRDSMRESAAPYLRPGEPIQAVIGAQTASQWLLLCGGATTFAVVACNVDVVPGHRLSSFGDQVRMWMSHDRKYSG